MEKNINLGNIVFCDCYNGLSIGEEVEIHNIYCRNNHTGVEIYENKDDVIDELFSKPSDVLLACVNGNYKISDRYVWINSYGKLESGSYEDDLPLADRIKMASWFFENSNWVKLSGYKEFERFISYCNEDGGK